MPFYANATSATTTGTDVWPSWTTTASYAANTVTSTSTVTNAIFVNWATDTTASVASVTTDVTWGHWIITDSTSATTVAWDQWVQVSEQQAGQLFHQQQIRPNQLVETAEEHEARLAREAERRAEMQRRAEEQMRERKEAEERSMALLRDLLDEKQKADLEAHGYFFVEGASGALYRIGKGVSGNVKTIDRKTGEWVESFCIHQSGVPVGDVMVAQKLLLETAEHLFHKYANVTKRKGGFKGAVYGSLKGEELDNVIDLAERKKAATDKRAAA